MATPVSNASAAGSPHRSSSAVHHRLHVVPLSLLTSAHLLRREGAAGAASLLDVEAAATAAHAQSVRVLVAATEREGSLSLTAENSNNKANNSAGSSGVGDCTVDTCLVRRVAVGADEPNEQRGQTAAATRRDSAARAPLRRSLHLHASSTYHCVCCVVMGCGEAAWTAAEGRERRSAAQPKEPPVSCTWTV